MTAHIIYTTWPDKATAADVGRGAVERDLCACVNILPPHDCIYAFEGTVESGTEMVMILKAPAKTLDALRDWVVSKHPYDVPVFAVLDINTTKSHPAFIEWLGAPNTP